MIELRLPSGITKSNPTENDIDDLLALTASDWAQGSGDAMISSLRDEMKVNLVIIKSFDGRYFIEHTNKSERVYNPHVALRDNQYLDACVTVHVGGEEHDLPEACFLEQSAAREAIFQFINSGELTQHVEWKRRSEIAWPCADEEDEDF